ncbi:MAG: hypothetical protein AAFQ09_01695 [Pseudomonadota bacterium]
MTNRLVLLLIAAFLTLTVGSFIYYVATWEGRDAASLPASIILPKILPPEAPAFQERATL